jgi:nucleoside-diphosphate-sugar epimerase
MNEPSRYAIIGATGFLGRRVCRIIKQRNPDSQILPFGRFYKRIDSFTCSIIVNNF